MPRPRSWRIRLVTPGYISGKQKRIARHHRMRATQGRQRRRRRQMRAAASLGVSPWKIIKYEMGIRVPRKKLRRLRLL